MAICLVTAPTVTEFTSPNELSSSSVRWLASHPQLGVLSLASILEHRGDNLRIVNLNRIYYEGSRFLGTNGDDFAEAAALEISKQEAEIYGFGSICSSYPLTLRIAQRVKQLQPTSAILVGGPQASVVDLQTLAAFPFVDFVLRGEAERSLPALLEQLQGDKQFDRVAGLSYRVDNQARRNPAAKLIENLDELPSPGYQITGELQGATTAALELGRGCPYACTFCSTNDFFRRNFRLRSPQRILLEMRWIAAEYGIRNFDLVHDMFTVDRHCVVAFCEAMRASGEGFTWSCSARTDRVDTELLEIMAQAGCTGIFYGVEVGSLRMQRVINKNLDLEWAKKVIDDTERLGMRSTVSLITGFPEETWEDVRQTVRIYMHAALCPHSSPQLNILAPLAETPVFLKHRQALVLDDLCSDMSHQGCQQSPADLQLIREHRDIFPNFYLLPLAYLDRHCILELREFAINALEHFRWLLIALDQNAKALEELFVEWREHRCLSRPGLNGLDLRRYYRTVEFREDFQFFVRHHFAASNPAVAILLNFEQAMQNAMLSDKSVRPMGSLLPSGCDLWWSDIPVTKPLSTVIEFSHDIQALIESLRFRDQSLPAAARHFYLRRERSRGNDGVEEISDWLANMLRKSDGRHTIKEIFEHMAGEVAELEASVRDYALLRLLEGAQAKQFIDIYRQ